LSFLQTYGLANHSKPSFPSIGPDKPNEPPLDLDSES